MTDFPLIIVCSVTNLNCYESRGGFKQCLPYIGVNYILMLTDSNLTLPQSYNSIVKTNEDDLKNAEYVIFVAQDIWFLELYWGKKIIDYCDVLSDLGCAGVECRDINANPVNYCNYRCNVIQKLMEEHDGKQHVVGNIYPKASNPVKVVACDCQTFIIPSKLFLERQFDEQFDWFPMAEDYACWIRLIKKLEVYSLPLEIGNSFGFSKYNTKFKDQYGYLDSSEANYKRLLEKWNLKDLPTTTSCAFKSWRQVLDERRRRGEL